MSGLRTRRRAVRRRRRRCASVPGEQFTRGAGVSKGNDAAAAARVAQRQRGCCALCGCLGRCSARAVRPGDAVRGSASRKMNQRRVRSARCANKLCRRLAQAVLASVLLAASAQIAGRVIRTPTIAIHRRTMAPSARQQPRETALVSQVCSPKIHKIRRAARHTDAAQAAAIAVSRPGITTKQPQQVKGSPRTASTISGCRAGPQARSAS